MTGTVAAVDCGTNTTRLLISDGRTDRVRISRITGLGRGLEQRGALAPEAIGRVEEALGEFRVLITRHGVERVRATATSAARDASNSAEFFDRAEAALGVRPELLSGDAEGCLTFTGATRSLDGADGPFLVLDIGGGSTEFSVGSDSCSGVYSTQMGSVRFTERFLLHDPPHASELSNLLQVLKVHMDEVVAKVPGVREASTMVAVAGTATTIAAVEIGLDPYDPERIEGFVLTREAAEDVFRTLATEPLATRLHNPGLEPGRADVIVAGAAILVGVMRFLDFDSCLISEHDILDGMVASLLDPEGVPW